MIKRYKIHRIHKQKLPGITQPAYCSLRAILKTDHPESPDCVYNEYVATRLAQTLHIPLADGVLTDLIDGPAYASLELNSPGASLPDILEKQIPKVADRYPDEIGALVAFDILIGNWDRSLNLKAVVATKDIQIFCAFDHSHSLLNIESTAWESIKKLRSYKLIAKAHPFYGRVKWRYLNKWIKRISSVDDDHIRECCELIRGFRKVGISVQKDLASALIWRKRYLLHIIRDHLSIINPEPI